MSTDGIPVYNYLFYWSSQNFYKQNNSDSCRVLICCNCFDYSCDKLITACKLCIHHCSYETNCQALVPQCLNIFTLPKILSSKTKNVCFSGLRGILELFFDGAACAVRCLKPLPISKHFLSHKTADFTCFFSPIFLKIRPISKGFFTSKTTDLQFFTQL